MGVFYLDTSALVKRYAQEVGTPWVLHLTDPAAGNEIFTGLLTGPETIAALSRKARTRAIMQADATRASSIFRADWQTLYLVVDVTADIADNAMDLAETHGLRGYDAVHLAVAVELHTRRQALGLSGPTFVSADDDQLEVARTMGLVIENPNSYA